MIRRLLTLLALCAGLAAIGEPARADIVSDPVRLVEQASLACGISAPQRQAGLLTTLPRPDSGASFCPRPVLPIIVPTVMLQVDRAHE